jgi:hypothetical protein
LRAFCEAAPSTQIVHAAPVASSAASPALRAAFGTRDATTATSRAASTREQGGDWGPTTAAMPGWERQPARSPATVAQAVQRQGADDRNSAVDQVELLGSGQDGEPHVDDAATVAGRGDNRAQATIVFTDGAAAAEWTSASTRSAGSRARITRCGQNVRLGDVPPTGTPTTGSCRNLGHQRVDRRPTPTAQTDCPLAFPRCLWMGATAG